MRSASRRPVLDDPTIYPVSEKVGEDLLQRWIVELLRPLVARWLAERRVRALVGADQFIYYRQFDAHARVSPDVYVLPGVAPTTRVRSWKTWDEGIVPSFAFECVSLHWRKDYAAGPERYEALGVTELVIFDPDWQVRADGIRWQVYRRLARRGLVRVQTSWEDRVRSRVLGAWLRAVDTEAGPRIRLGVGARGARLYPTAEEAAQAARQAAARAREAERAAREAERAAREAERAAREALAAAQARVRQLETRLGRSPRARRR